MATKVIIIDENQAERQEAAKAFALYECVVLDIESTGQLGDIVKKEKPELLIIDPRGKLNSVEEIKADINLRSVPLVVHTADATRANVLKIAKLGARDYVLKPLPPDLLGERIGRIVDLPRKKRNIKDAVRILVLENKPMVVDQIKSICEGTTWEVVHVTKESEAIAYIANRLPDVILASLSLPNEQGHALFNTLKADDRTRRIPYFGLSVKTALEEQTRAQQDGMTGIFTKPLDINDMRQRLTRALNVDVSEKYFAVKENILHVSFPAQMDVILSEIAPNITSKIAEMVDAGMGKAMFDLTQVANMDTNIIRVLIQAIELCAQLGVTYAVVGSSALATKAQAFEETKSITIFEDVDQALKTLT